MRLYWLKMLRLAIPLLLCGLVFTACTTAKPHTDVAGMPKAEAAPNVVANPLMPAQAYTDGISIVVELLPLKSKGEGSRALLRVTGVDSYLAGVTLLVTRYKTGQFDSWATMIDGHLSHIVAIISPDTLRRIAKGERSPLSRRTNTSRFIELFLNRGPSNVTLHYDPTASALIDVDDLIRDHRSHIADGSLERIANFDRSYSKKAAASALSKGQEKLRTSCKKKIAVTMNWNSVRTHDDFMEVGFCRSAVDLVGKLCSDRLSDQVAIAEKLDAIHCEFEPDHSLRYDAGNKSWLVHSTQDQLLKSDASKKSISRSLDLPSMVLKSKKGIYFVAPAHHNEDRRLFFGMGTKLHRHWRGGKGDVMRKFTLWTGLADFYFDQIKPGEWRARCLGGEVDFSVVQPEERDRVLKSSTFESALWTRENVLLARDDRGIYYYVDKKRRELGGLDYRVYKGPRGQVKLTTMVDIVDDGEGQIFATTSGSLRLVLRNRNQQSAKWIVGKKQRELVIIPNLAKFKLLYGPRNLGIYGGQDEGTLCSLDESMTGLGK